MMDIKIKKAIKAGNSSAVLLPKSWLNKEIRVELLRKTPVTILLDTITLVQKYIDLKDIIGIYLTGSYARSEEDENSDIDILIITKDIDREMISEGIYNLLIISSELLKQKMDQDLFPVGAMIKEAKPLLNSDYLDSINVEVTNRNVKWYIDTTEDKLRVIQEVLDKTKKKNKESLSDLVAYTLILRIRTIGLIEKLIKNEDYSKKRFIELINKLSKGANAYERYLAVKNNLKEEQGISLKEAEQLYEYLRSQLIKVKSLLQKTK